MIRRGTFEQVIKYQIEYYFGDKNYFKDSFLQAFKTDGNPEGYVPIVELLRFSKMKVNLNKSRVLLRYIELTLRCREYLHLYLLQNWCNLLPMYYVIRMCLQFM
jgi:hypothetical protein